MSTRKVHYHFIKREYSLPVYCRGLRFPRTTTGKPRDAPVSTQDPDRVACQACRKKMTRLLEGAPDAPSMTQQQGE